MKKKLLPVVAIVFIAGFFLACDRQSKPLADRSAVLGMPKYGATTEVDNVAAPVHIASIAPKVGGAPDGEALYAAQCLACHQMTGQGIPSVFPPLDASVYVTSDNVERLAAIMVYGLVGPIKVNGIEYNNAMLALGPKLNDEELAAIATYIRTSWSNTASPVEASVFAAVREKYGDRGQFKIAELGEEG